MDKWLTRAVCLLATLLVAGAVFPEIHPSDSDLSRELKEALQSWNARTEAVKAPHFSDHEQVDGHSRSKRAIIRPNLNGGCQTPGYTGQHCEFPICDSIDETRVSDELDLVTIDFGFFKNATTPLFFPVDKELGLVEVQMDVSLPVSPSFVVKDLAGKQVEWAVAEPAEETRFLAKFIPPKPGTYIVYPTAENLLTPVDAIIHVRAYTPVQIQAGFIPAFSNNGAPERYDFLNATVTHGQPNVIAAKVTHLARPGSIATFSILYDQYQQYLTRPQEIQIRYGCSHEYYYEMFVCNTPGKYLMKFDGYDFFGNSFSRITTFFCEAALVTTPAPSSPTTPLPAITQCWHGGHMIKEKDNTTSCFCEGLYTGRDCRTPLCLHGGRPLDAAPMCTCPGNFYGNHCENVRCQEKAGVEHSLENPTLVLVFRVRQQMSDVINQINAQLQVIAAMLQFDPEYLQHIVVVTFNGGKVFGSRQYSSIKAVSDDLKTIANTTDDSGGCVDTVYSAISEVFDKFPIALKSPIYVFSDAVPSDVDQVDYIYGYNAYFYSPIYFMLVQNPTMQNCENDRYGKYWRTMEALTVRSGGMVFDPLPPADVGTFFQTHMYATFYRTQVVYENDLRVCSEQPQLQTIAVDQRIDELIIIAQGTNLSLSLLNPQGQQVTFTNTRNLGSAYLWSLRGPIKGQYSFNVLAATGTPCQYRAYASPHKDHLASDKEFKMIWGFTNADDNDAPFRVPIVGMPLRLVTHVQGYKVPPMWDNAEVAVYANHARGRELVFAANSVWRDGCSFEIEFPAYTCYHPDEDLYFNLFIRDRQGDVIQRSGHFFCAYIPPTLTPPDGCQNGGVSMNGTCLCPPLWSGKQCQTRVCLNGGTNIRGVYCECPPGHVGPSCEMTSCILEGNEPKVDFGNRDRSMIFLLDMSMSNWLILKDLSANIPRILRDLKSHHERWISDYTVIGYNSTWNGVLTNAKWDQEHIVVEAFQNASALAVQYGDVHCSVRMWQALADGVGYSGVNGYINIFQAGLANENDIRDIISVYDAVTLKRIRVNAFQQFWDKGHSTCESNRTAHGMMEDLVAITEGQFYPLDVFSFKHALYTLPAMFMQNLVDRRNVQNCTVPQTFYLPVDSYAQSVQITVFGYLAKMDVFNPKGNKAGNDLLTEVVSDDKTGTYIYEVRRACPDEWQPIGKAPYCALFGIEQLTWTEARNYCKDAGGFLADEVDSEKGDFLDMDSVHVDHWFGLNDLAQNGKWMWDRGSRSEMPLQTGNGSYNNWASGEPANDTTKRCGARLYKNGSKKAQWYSADCQEKRGFICQRHKYSDTYSPNRVDDDDLPTGKWRVELQTQLATMDNQSYPECYYEVRVQSKIGILSGFALNEHSDKNLGYPTAGTNKNIFITHLTGNEVTAVQPKLTYSMLYDFLTHSMSAGVTYQRRENCQYEFYSQNFDCPSGKNPNNLFAAIHTGEDEFGVSFQRLTTGHCKKPTQLCGNGGVIYQGQCICDEFWTGADCKTPVCVNGGTLDVFRNQCRCPKGFTGDACQWPICTPKTPYNFDKNGKTFALLIENTQANSDALTALRNQLKHVLGAADQTSKPNHWFKNYMLMTFTEDGQSVINEYSDVDSFINSFTQYTQNPDNRPQKCSYPIFTLLANLMSHKNFANPNSVIYLVSRGVPNDLKDGVAYFEQLGAQTRAQLFVKLIKDPACNIKGMETLLAHYAYSMNGNFFYLPGKDLGAHMAFYLPAIYGSSVLSTPTLLSNKCFQLQESVQVDKETTGVFVTLYMDQYSAISVTDPFGSTVSLQTLYDQDNTKLISFTPSTPGLFTFFINSSSETCMVQIRGKNGPQIFTGFVAGDAKTSIHNDNIMSVPSPNVNNVFVAHSSVPTKLTMVEFFGRGKNNTEEVKFLQLNPRWDCSFEYYSPPFQCFADSFFTYIHGIDSTGATFRRLTYFSCIGLNGTVPTLPPYIPPTTPPPTSPPITPKNIVVDVFLLIDTSTDMNNETYQKELISFIVNTFGYFDMSQNGLNFGIFAVDGSEGIPVDMRYSLGPLSAPAVLQTKLAIMGDAFVSTSQGQAYLKDTLNMISDNPNIVQDPAFTKVNNRVVIYFTSSAVPSKDAILKASAMRTSGKFGFMTVAYKGDGSNTESLSSLAGGDGCSFSASAVEQLKPISEQIQAKIWNAAQADNSSYC
uniref:EGF-like domain-containing protein n=1 Tax=Steinernema glaseri TaxID=37863 RepID=A0A1I8AUJ5_9BILA